MISLYDYYRSSAAYRVRIALNLKGLDYRQLHVNLREGEQLHRAYRGLNAQGLVPTLETEDGQLLRQSLAICEYLEEAYPQPALLPAESSGRARVRALAQLIACDVHPLNNLRVHQYLEAELGVSDDQQRAWYHHWVHEGFRALESMLAAGPQTGRFCLGEQPTLADLCLVPQVFNANRFGVDLGDYRNIRRINDACLEIEAFDRARPERQPDALSGASTHS
ncbi:MAG: maleylacetoacetate isomerase [Nitrococcus sp.]|nr:maleylacetoacetate isomerase [Nitrococcus sp.]